MNCRALLSMIEGFLEPELDDENSDLKTVGMVGDAVGVVDKDGNRFLIKAELIPSRPAGATQDSGICVNGVAV